MLQLPRTGQEIYSWNHTDKKTVNAKGEEKWGKATK